MNKHFRFSGSTFARLEELGVRAAAKIPVQGARYPEELQKLVGR